MINIMHASAAMVIVFSQHDDAGYREHFQQAGAHFFFNKAQEAGKLIATLTELASCHAAVCDDGARVGPAHNT